MMSKQNAPEMPPGIQDLEEMGIMREEHDLNRLSTHLGGLMLKSGLSQSQLVDMMEGDEAWKNRPVPSGNLNFQANAKLSRSGIQGKLSKILTASARQDTFFLEMIARSLFYWYNPEKHPKYDKNNPDKLPNMVTLIKIVEKKNNTKVESVPSLKTDDIDMLYTLSGYSAPRALKQAKIKTTDDLPAIQELSPLIQEFNAIQAEILSEKRRYARQVREDKRLNPPLSE